MRNKYFWAASVWTIVIMVCCLISMKNFEAVDSTKYTDKYVHFTFYFGFTMLWYFFFRLKNIGSAKKNRLIVFVMAVVFGMIIELCQEFFTADRSADIVDVAANTSGATAAVLVLWLYDTFKKK